jgi:hypothetical protein
MHGGSSARWQAGELTIMSEFAAAHLPPQGTLRIPSIAYQMFIEASI